MPFFQNFLNGILAAALLTGLSGVLGNFEFVKNNETLYGINTLINISSGAIFGFLPLAVAYSACKRFGGRPILGIVIGCIMLSNSLADMRERLGRMVIASSKAGDPVTCDDIGAGGALTASKGGIVLGRRIVKVAAPDIG